ncbi:hypothetical protein SHKM778_34920 [Streptomyces sp. KM77-8]|uniref:Uncharacterized protein n=1 Tax=Streptomyces haneummycinicus TaxID=3074435 RepID=A0AAT9HIV3_9ACTN
MATFYAMFSLRPRPSTVLHVCTDLACTAAGATRLCAEIESGLGPESECGWNAAPAWACANEHRRPW